MRTFDPRKIAHYEKENYVAYYQKRWLRLLRASVGMVKEAFVLSLWQAIYGAYLVARAEIAFAPFPDNDVPLAQAFMRRFFALIKKLHHAEFDVAEVARLEVHWWGVHRRLFGQAENGELVDALAAATAAAYGLAADQLREAAYHRAQGILYSDLWVNDGQEENSPLLAQEEEELVKAYTALRTAVSSLDER